MKRLSAIVTAVLLTVLLILEGGCFVMTADGTAIDYSDFSIQELTVGKLSGDVRVGSAVPKSAVLAQGNTNKNIADGVISAVSSRIGITDYPSIKINKDGGKYEDHVRYATFTTDLNFSSANPLEVMYYIELPAGKTVSAEFSWIFENSLGDDYYCHIYSGKCWLMASEEKEWTSTNIAGYQFSFPVGFKGYVKFVVNNIVSQNNSPAGGRDVFMSDTNKKLYSTHIGLFGVTASDDVYFSAPVFVTKGGSVPFAAFVDGDRTVARNIFTGAVMTENDLQDFSGVEGNENLNQGQVPEIDYKIPEYTGQAYDYGDREFARIRQFILQDNIAVGYKIPLTTFDDGHENKNNAYSQLVEPLIGISDMPFFSITKTTGNPAESNVTVATWHPKKFETANANAGAIIQYLKLPSDLEKVFCSVYMSAVDENYLVKNIAPYNGIIYYMEKGTTEWLTAKITAYWFELPKGFEGYIMYDTDALRAQSDSSEWGPDWLVFNYILRIANLSNQTVIASAPFLADSIGDIDYACYINDETKAVRNIFTGAVITPDDIRDVPNIGDIIDRLPSTITSSKHIISGSTISKIAAGTTVSSLLAGLNEGSYCKVYKGSSQVSGSTAIGTGMVVKIMDGNTVKASYTIIVTGDINGDGAISVTDMIAIKAHILNKSTLSGVYATAANTNGDSGISITDFIQVKAKILGKGNITAR